MKILILGGSGFIGSHVVDAALSNGYFVRVFDREHERSRPTPEMVEFVQGDISDTNKLSEALIGIDMVFHLVSTTVPSTANFDPISDVQGNLIFTLRLLGLMRMRGIRRLLYLSSGGTVYGVPTIDPVPESHALMPISSYGIVKAAIEHYLRVEQAENGLDALIVRPSNPFGPRQTHGGVQGIIGTYMGMHARGQRMELWGDGSIVRDFIHVRDVARLCIKLAETGVTGTFNAGAGEGRSINQIIEGIGRVSGQSLAPILKPARKFDIQRVVLDITSVYDAVGWAPEISFEDGLAETWAWVRDQVQR